jgi:hypothetical protein
MKTITLMLLLAARLTTREQVRVKTSPQYYKIFGGSCEE